MAQFITADEAAKLIKDGDTVQLSNFCANSICEDVIVATRDRFDKEGSPKNLNVHIVSGAGDFQLNGRGLNHWDADGMISTFFGSHVGNLPNLNPLFLNNKITGHLVPQGVCTRLLRQMAAGESGLYTKIGLGTYADPRVEGCRITPEAKGTVVELVHHGDEELLYYPSYHIDVALLKGSYADEDGNISLDLEPVLLEQLEVAAATHLNGGKVIVQVHKVVQRGSINARNIKIPAKLVDYVVVGRPENTYQTYFFPDEIKPELTGAIKVSVGDMKIMPFGLRKIVARRGAMELKPGVMTNIGGGMAEGVPAVATEEGFYHKIQFSVESGIIGGVPVEGGIGSAYNPDVVLRQPENFDLYSGGFLDVTFLGCAEADAMGNVNVSKVPGKIIGPGGFVDITQNTPKICYLGSFTAGKSNIQSGDGKLHIIEDGPKMKFVNTVSQITFSGTQCAAKGQEVMFITERAVFKITEKGLMLIEIAPGVDLEKDVLGRMEFKPLIADDLKIMDERIFKDEKMNFSI